jgi:hypothetical protein
VTPDSGGIRVRYGDSALGETDGGRKTVTALFADIKGSMDLIENIPRRLAWRGRWIRTFGPARLGAKAAAS